MKVCKEHVKLLRRGMTYQVVSKEECEVCVKIDEIIKNRSERDFMIPWCGW